ncbi:universal stress protein family protein [Brevibacterium sanguinis]|uniref:Universal stress protein family protein n=2 Tax=Brevibacterium TaxID=1696 RepID=A0A366IHF3_9MICO|nr:MULTISPECIES: universal stress protein [Brevibacterium]RBP64983.1 universal stress protein family protein [Brevibacterium sanguinis]RBP71246.1 universal stress protein family protein [Brevibacterium celere]
MSILVGYVPTETGEAAVDAAIREAAWRGVKLRIANSRKRGPLVSDSVAEDEALDAIRQRAADAGVDAEVYTLAHEDDAADSLLEAADAWQVDLIVIGLRKRSQVGKFIMGSLAQRILLQAEVPVLAVKAG